MQLRQLIQPGITASVLAHALLLGLVVLLSEVHPFSTVTAEPIAVDLVTPDEMVKRPDETKADQKKPDEDKLQLQLPKEDVTAPTEQVTAPAQQAAASTQQSASPPSSPPAATVKQEAPPAAPAKPEPQPAARPDRREASTTAQPQAPRQQSTEQQPVQQPTQQLAPSTPPVPQLSTMPATQQQLAYTPPEPDVTVKYGVMLGLPEALPAPSASGDRPSDGTDANASSTADISSSLVAKFREHLKTCSHLPATVARSDNVFVKLRVMMTPQAKLAAVPVLIEGTASAKALELKDSAVRALSACQPYDMLPIDRYGEWKVLDLSFTPQDFG